MSQPLFFSGEDLELLSRPAVNEELERLTLQMYRGGIRYSEAVREFQWTFLSIVLRDSNANQVKASEKLGIHRNTLRRQIGELKLDLKTFREPRRRPRMSDSVVGPTTRAKVT